jgi:hypothetical protein
MNSDLMSTTSLELTLNPRKTSREMLQRFDLRPRRLSTRFDDGHFLSINGRAPDVAFNDELLRRMPIHQGPVSSRDRSLRKLLRQRVVNLIRLRNHHKSFRVFVQPMHNARAKLATPT